MLVSSEWRLVWRVRVATCHLESPPPRRARFARQAGPLAPGIFRVHPLRPFCPEGRCETTASVLDGQIKAEGVSVHAVRILRGADIHSKPGRTSRPDGKRDVFDGTRSRRASFPPNAPSVRGRGTSRAIAQRYARSQTPGCSTTIWIRGLCDHPTTTGTAALAAK